MAITFHKTWWYWLMKTHIDNLRIFIASVTLSLKQLVSLNVFQLKNLYSKLRFMRNQIFITFTLISLNNKTDWYTLLKRSHLQSLSASESFWVKSDESLNVNNAIIWHRDVAQLKTAEDGEKFINITYEIQQEDWQAEDEVSFWYRHLSEILMFDAKKWSYWKNKPVSDLIINTKGSCLSHLFSQWNPQLSIHSLSLLLQSRQRCCGVSLLLQYLSLLLWHLLLLWSRRYCVKQFLLQLLSLNLWSRWRCCFFSLLLWFYSVLLQSLILWSRWRYCIFSLLLWFHSVFLWSRQRCCFFSLLLWFLSVLWQLLILWLRWRYCVFSLLLQFHSVLLWLRQRCCFFSLLLWFFSVLWQLLILWSRWSYCMISILTWSKCRFFAVLTLMQPLD